MLCLHVFRQAGPPQQVDSWPQAGVDKFDQESIFETQERSRSRKIRLRTPLCSCLLFLLNAAIIVINRAVKVPHSKELTPVTSFSKVTRSSYKERVQKF